MTQTVDTEVVKDWTWEELRRELFIWTGIELGKTQFYKWMRYSLISPKEFYNPRDRAKIVNFGRLMLRYKKLSKAQEELIKDIQNDDQKYPQED